MNEVKLEYGFTNFHDACKEVERLRAELKELKKPRKKTTYRKEIKKFLDLFEKWFSNAPKLSDDGEDRIAYARAVLEEILEKGGRGE